MKKQKRHRRHEDSVDREAFAEACEDSLKRVYGRYKHLLSRACARASLTEGAREELHRGCEQVLRTLLSRARCFAAHRAPDEDEPAVTLADLERAWETLQMDANQ